MTQTMTAPHTSATPPDTHPATATATAPHESTASVHGRRAARPRGRERRSGRGGILHTISVGISAGVFALVLALAAILIVVPWASGATPMTILTSSMEPTLPPGTLVVVKPEPIDDIRVGDVMTYQIQSGKPAVVSHRVIAISSSSDGSRAFTTKGDNNAVADPTVVAGQVKGVVWYSLPWIGYVSTAVNGPDRSWLIPAIAVVLLGYAGFMILGGLLDARKKRRRSRRE